MIFKGIINISKYAWSTKNVWWYIASQQRNAKLTNTKLGVIWIGLSKLLVIFSIAMVYGKVLKIDNFPEYVVSLGIGLTCWTALNNTIVKAASTFTRNTARILNTNINPIFYLLENWAIDFQDLVQALIYVLIFLTFFKPFVILNFISISILSFLNFIILFFGYK